MKKNQTILIASILVIGLVLSGMALAIGPGDRGHRGFGSHRFHKSQGLGLLMKYQLENLRIQVLSEMAGQPTEAINSKLKDQRMRAVLDELNIDRQAFRTAMQEKVNQLIKQAAETGAITVEQEKLIYEKMKNRTERRELMTRLIEKGLEDGTITQEQAQMLQRKPR
jgi:hypothetical protein